MDIAKQKDLEGLLDFQQSPAVSIFIPTYQKGREVRQNPIRLKNALKKAEEQLEGLGLGSRESKDLLTPAADMIDDQEFWKDQKGGLALFLARDRLHYFKVPYALEELVVASTDRFHLKPVLPLLTEDSRYYILALSQNRVRLIECSKFDAEETSLENSSVPGSIEEALQYDDPEKQLQFRSSASRSPSPQGSRWASVFHGHGAVDEVKDNLRRYFLQIDAGIREIIGSRGPALILAGVDYLLPIYADVNKYSDLLDAGISGNPDHLGVEELHEKSRPLVAPLFRQSQERASEIYYEKMGTGLASNSLSEILPAARQGRVEQLFTAVGVHIWGTLDTEGDRVNVHDDVQPGDEDLLDLAAFLTFHNSGSVLPLDPEDLPDSSPIAAIFRY